MFGIALDHLHLRSLDPDAAGRFYVDHLGATLADRVETGDSLRVVLSLAGVRLFIERAPAGMRAAADAPHRGLEHIGLKVDDLAAAAAALKAKGVAFTREPEEVRPGLRIAFIRGPDDVSIELLQRG